MSIRDLIHEELVSNGNVRVLAEQFESYLDSERMDYLKKLQKYFLEEGIDSSIDTTSCRFDLIITLTDNYEFIISYFWQGTVKTLEPMFTTELREWKEINEFDAIYNELKRVIKKGVKHNCLK